MSEPSPRRRARRKDARPEELIEAGLHEFAQHGFAGTRLEDVAQRAGVVKGTIYRYFANKEELFLAILKSRLQAIIDPPTGFVEAFPGPTRELLKMVIGAIHDRLVNGELRVLLRIIIVEGSRFPSLKEQYHRETIAKGLSLLERIVARGVARGEIRADHAARLPMVLMAPAIMAVIWKTTFDDLRPISSDEFRAAHLDLVLNGVFIERGNSR